MRRQTSPRIQPRGIGSRQKDAPDTTQNYVTQAYPCERGLITGHVPDRASCELRKGRLQSTTAEEATRGAYVLHTLGESATLLCEREHQEKRTLALGVRCTLAGATWWLAGEVLQFALARGTHGNLYRGPPQHGARQLGQRQRNELHRPDQSPTRETRERVRDHDRQRWILRGVDRPPCILDEHNYYLYYMRFTNM